MAQNQKTCRKFTKLDFTWDMLIGQFGYVNANAMIAFDEVASTKKLVYDMASGRYQQVYRFFWVEPCADCADPLSHKR